ncbi:MAG: 16S rRNA (cytosine(1402)-N(4))-methyltransferase RsmH [Clostridiales bacterium]|jgi:16S rRNA (cytosine1402-N4)-methyltransferase|nr:16S rRNA (cytosine(1402)-N(4))-methyltransferase RsmH [Clostridiales bacterium]
MENFSHIPVMPREAIDALNIKPDGIYVDCTLGGGGHSSLICEKLESGKLFGIDRDGDAIAAANCRIKSKNFFPIRGNFHDLENIMDKHDVKNIDGILIDLGVSSHQIDTPERGFSFRYDGPLDMRMDSDAKTSAHAIVNNFSESDLKKIFFEYGEERFSKRIARAICKQREIAPIDTTLQLADIIDKAVPVKKQLHPAMRVFMALRIAVNDELAPLRDVLLTAVRLLSPGGRIAAVTFHSLEDRIVKKTFVKLASPCECPRDIPYCVCGKTPTVRIISHRPITPSPEELSLNSRAHSAKLRIAEKII